MTMVLHPIRKDGRKPKPASAAAGSADAVGEEHGVA
jgi:hypothetical protein